MPVSYENFVKKISEQIKKSKQLENLIEKFQTQYNLTPCAGVEIEFYLSPNINVAEFENLLGIKVKHEKGKNQFEIDLPPSTDLINYVKEIIEVQIKLTQTAAKLNGSIDLTAKPFLDDYGNSMHFHVNFLTDEKPVSSELIILAAKSLCLYMLDNFVLFMPRETDYQRLDKNYMAPVNVSFGGNNRTVAVRVPDLMPCRLEHRLSNPLTDPYIALSTILKSIFLGFANNHGLNNYNKIYGNAFDEQYQLELLPTDPLHALKLFN